MLSVQKHSNIFNSPKLRALKLFAFRGFDRKKFVFEGKHIFISGENGVGKTALLEALSLFAPGKGLKNAKLIEMQSVQNFTQPWCVNLDFMTAHNQFFEVATAFDSSSGNEKRLIKLNHTIVKQSELQEVIQFLWLTPQLERQFHESNSARRKFLDRLLSQHDHAHMGRVARYEKLMTQRSYLLKQAKYDPLWVDVLEQDISKTAISIIAVRLDFLEQLQFYCQNLTSSFPEIELFLMGELEQMFISHSALEIEHYLFEVLKKARKQQDISPIGAHKSQLEMVFKENKTPYKLCSTGQQKAIFIRLLLGHMALLRDENQVSPIVLLDDIAAHLDLSRLNYLIEELDQTAAQIFYSATHFSGLNIENKHEIML